MKFHATAPAFSIVSPNFVRSYCPECQDLLVSAAKSQHVNADVIHHWWACESCGHEFRTTVQLPSLTIEVAEAALA
jgi:RNase P subunit RPR2